LIVENTISTLLFPLAQAAENPSPWWTLWPILVIGLLFYLLIMRPQRREQSQREVMLTNLKKNDHVVTIGGIHGVVTNVRREVDEVTIKVDEATNTKLRVSLSAIARVVAEEPSAESSAS
jgi:preprotein translocase subunit YajC